MILKIQTIFLFLLIFALSGSLCQPVTNLFYPFGDQILPKNDDDFFRVNFSFPFAFFDHEYSNMFVATNGYLVLDGISEIAPFNLDLTTETTGDIYHGELISNDTLASISNDVNVYYPNAEFQTTHAYVVSWLNVPSFANQTQKNTFQILLVRSPVMSFLIYNYLTTESTPKYSGFKDYYKSSNRLFFRPKKGIAIFQVQSMAYVSTTTIAPINNIVTTYGRNASIGTLDKSDDLCKNILLNFTFYYFSHPFSNLTICIDGYLHLGNTTSRISPFELDLTTLKEGHVTYAHVTDPLIHQTFSFLLNTYSDSLDTDMNLEVQNAFAVTWANVSSYYFPTNKNTFQSWILVTKNNGTVLVFNYGRLDSKDALSIGFTDNYNSSNNVDFDASLTDSNVGRAGRFVYVVDEGDFDDNTTTTTTTTLSKLSSQINHINHKKKILHFW
jgi:hypothetical protein